MIIVKIEPATPVTIKQQGRHTGKRNINCLANSKAFQRKLSLRFTLPDKIIYSSPADQSDCSLLQLPCEVQMLVYENVDHAPTQVAMALTCKQMARVAAHVNLSRAYTSAKLAGQVPKEVFDIPPLMIQLSTWIPETLRLCNHCLTFRPCDTDYWSTVRGCEKGTFWVQKTGWTFANGGWQKQKHNICPSCHLTCGLSDYIECDGCRALGRLGDIDWHRVSGMQRRAMEFGSDPTAA